MVRTRSGRSPRRTHAVALAVAASVALGLHWLVLGDAPAVPLAPGVVQAVTVRTVEPVIAAAPAVAAPARPAAPPRARTRRPAARTVAAGPASAAQAEPAPTSVEISAEVVLPVVGLAAPAADAFPVYRTALPPPARLHYEMKRGMFSGSGDLVWKPAGDHYEARLEASVAGLAVLTQVSTGLIEAGGLAPLRYTDQRLRRAINAANFQRDAGKITYSGPQVEFPLPPGAQDRLSWMLQLGAVLNAEPQHAAPGGHVTFFVTGARGDADAWTFRYVGAETVGAAGGAIRAVKFTRQPREAYDRLVEIWLAPERRHLPVRARFSAEADGEVFELLLRDIQPP